MAKPGRWAESAGASPLVIMALVCDGGVGVRIISSRRPAEEGWVKRRRPSLRGTQRLGTWIHPMGGRGQTGCRRVALVMVGGDERGGGCGMRENPGRKVE